jgi:type IV pilus assembly protein PilB
MAAISGEARSASVISNGRSVVKRFPGDKLPELIEKYPEVAKHLFKVLVNRLDYSDKVIVKLVGDIMRKKSEDQT